jgi:hypothetical protein
VLHGPENDRTLGMRNWLAYSLTRQMGRYASRTRFFELFMNLVRQSGQAQRSSLLICSYVIDASIGNKYPTVPWFLIYLGSSSYTVALLLQ